MNSPGCAILLCCIPTVTGLICLAFLRESCVRVRVDDNRSALHMMFDQVASTSPVIDHLNVSLVQLLVSGIGTACRAVLFILSLLSTRNPAQLL